MRLGASPKAPVTFQIDAGNFKINIKIVSDYLGDVHYREDHRQVNLMFF